MAVEWGAMKVNPMFRLRKIKRPPRRRYVTDEEYLAVRTMALPMYQCAMDLALLTGLRRKDILDLRCQNVTDSTLRVKPSKTAGTTGVELEFELTPELRAVIDKALKIGPQIRPWILCNRKGQQFTKNGFDSVWGRLMRKAVAAGIERFHFRDLRKKSASDEDDGRVASERLGHSSQEITDRVYRVLPRKVRPLR